MKYSGALDCFLDLSFNTSFTPIMLPRKDSSIKGNDEMDWCLYKYRHLVENAFARLEHFFSYNHDLKYYSLDSAAIYRETNGDGP